MPAHPLTARSTPPARPLPARSTRPARLPLPATRLPERPWPAALLLALPLLAAYLIVAPPAGDLAAATYRSDLFARAPFATWDTGWYAAHGHWLPSYSLLSPALGAVFGVRLLLALSALAAIVLFALIADRVFGRSAGRAASVVFALGFSVGLLSGRVPYDLGFALGLGAVLALIEDRFALALALAALTSIASPVAGAFLALAGLAYAVINTRRGLALTAVALAPVLTLSLAYPEGGYEPFAPSAFWPALAGVVLIALLLPRGPLSERGRRVVRVGAGLYALALIGAFLLRTPVGGNAARLGPLLAAPLIMGVLWESLPRVPLHSAGRTWTRRNRAILAALAPVLLYWQLVTPLRDVSSLAGNTSTSASYYAPLLSELRSLRGGEGRGSERGRSQGAARAANGQTIVEIPMTAAHWESAYVAGHDNVSLARGWERQLDTRYAALFYRPTLSASDYRAWLASNRVAYVALPDTRLDSAARREGALIARGLPYLRPIWRSEHWRVYRFMG